MAWTFASKVVARIGQKRRGQRADMPQNRIRIWMQFVAKFERQQPGNNAKIPIVPQLWLGGKRCKNGQKVIQKQPQLRATKKCRYSSTPTVFFTKWGNTNECLIKHQQN